MTARKARETVATQPFPSVVVKHFRVSPPPVATCDRCDWSQAEASLAEMRIHVRHHPTHTATRSHIEAVRVWAETRDGNAWTELFGDQ